MEYIAIELDFDDVIPTSIVSLAQPKTEINKKRKCETALNLNFFINKHFPLTLTVYLIRFTYSKKQQNT